MPTSKGKTDDRPRLPKLRIDTIPHKDRPARLAGRIIAMVRTLPHLGQRVGARIEVGPMGFFVLRKGDSRRGAFEGFAAAAERNGFPIERRLTLEGHRLELFGNLSASDPKIVDLGDGDFAASYGFLLYRNLCGEVALKALHADFSPADFDWSDLAGLNVVLLRKAGTLHLLNDALGACRLYHDDDYSVVSNAFVAPAWLGCGQAFDLQGCFEYVFAGSCYGRRSPLKGISALPPNYILSVTGDRCETHRHPSPISQCDWPADVDLDTVAREHNARIDRLLEPVVAHYGERLRLSISGGFDSRLVLASLLKHGVRPVLFTYGADDDSDVRIARQIAEAETLPFEQIDKSRVETPPAEDFAATAERDLFAFDGWKADDGILSNGADWADRLHRHDRDQLPINGSLGEIYRNFFYLPDRPMRADDLVSSFFSQYDPAGGGELFDEPRYRATLASAIAEAVGAESGNLERWQVELAYPLFRGRYWTGRDGQINQRFGAMLFPFLERELIKDTARIPLTLKNMGRLQGRMIALQNARVADYPSSYGHALSAPAPQRDRFLYEITCRRPMALRRLAYRLKHRRPETRPAVLTPAYLARVIDPGLPYTRRLFRTERIASNRQLNCVLTLEYLATRLGLDSPEPVD